MLSNIFRRRSSSLGSKKKAKSVTLLVDEDETLHSVKVSRNLLIENSSYFQEILQSSELKKNTKLKLEDWITLKSLKSVIEFLEEETIFLDNYTDVFDILKVALRFKIAPIQALCIDHLISRIDIINVCEIYETASLLSVGCLQFQCLKFIDENSEEILQTRGYLTLNKLTALDIAKRESLNVDSEVSVFKAVIGWSINHCLRNNKDASDDDILMKSVGSFLTHIRFAAMSEEELKDPEVDKFYRFMYSEESFCRRRAASVASQSSTNLSEPRRYVSKYVYNLALREHNQSVKCGQEFKLAVSILKGKVFITGICLALKAFAATRKAGCLYVILSVTNKVSNESKVAHGTFLNTGEDSVLELGSPVYANESEAVEVVLAVKRAENMGHFVVGSDAQIIIPESKAIAMKLSAFSSVSLGEDDAVPCIFRGLEYFF